MKSFCRLLVASLAIVGASRTCAEAQPPSRSSTEVVVRAKLAFEAPEIDGTAEIRWRNDGADPQKLLRLGLFANRFGSLDGIGDLARQVLIDGNRYEMGRTELLAVESETGGVLGWSFVDREGTIAVVALPREVAPGAEARISVRFRTRLPNLLDVFGATDGLVVGDGGWYPTPLTVGAPPRPAATRTWATLTIPAGATLLLNGREFTGSDHVEIAAGEADDRLSFVLSRAPIESASVRAARLSARVYTVPSHELAHRISRNEEAGEMLLDTLRSILAAEEAGSPATGLSAPASPPVIDAATQGGERVVVRLPLRWTPSAPAAGMVLVSDRLFEIFPLLRPLHQRELAYAMFLAEELRLAATREPAIDRDWVAEGIAWRRADALYAARFREGREVREWIGLFNVFAIVDRFDTAPRIPFVRPFFPTSADDDPLRIRPDSMAGARPPGRFLFDKLEAKLGPVAFESVLATYAAGRDAFRDVLGRAGGKAATQLVDAWLAPYVRVNYALEDVERNPGAHPGARFTIRRESRDARPDSVEVGFEEGERTEKTRVDLTGETTVAERPAAAPVDRVVIDPDRKTVEPRLDDNRVPPRFQLLLDSADVEVSSTEFGFSTLVVGRELYDYRKNLAVAGFYTSRGYGLDAGVQLHFGEAIDPSLYRHNLFAYYALEELDRSFASDDVDHPRARGRLGGFGLRFHSFDTPEFENPSASYHVRAFFDGYDRSLGSDFNYVQGGGSVSATLPVRHGTVIAGQVLNGFSGETGGGKIPPQGLFSLGGFRSIRGIGAEDELGNDIFIVRAELRQLLPWRLDWNFEEALIARRLQLKAFVDAGRVEDSSRELYDPSGFAVGVGGGVNLFYDFMGFFPTTFYLDLATRADRGGPVQVLFGVGQPF